MQHAEKKLGFYFKKDSKIQVIETTLMVKPSSNFPPKFNMYFSDFSCS